MQWEPKQFSLEPTTIWGFSERGDWATHDGKYRGNWSPYIPRNLILRYSSEGDLILDQFVGGGTTLVEAKLLHRKSLGVDINPTAIKRCRAKTAFDYPNAGQVYIKQGDARSLNFVPNSSIDFICTHPPYADIIRYSDGMDGDLSNYAVKEFLVQMESVSCECFRVLKRGKFCAILIGDVRKRGHVVPIGFNVMKIFEKTGFRIKEIIIKEQHNCQSTRQWKTKSTKHNFLLLAHEYLFVFKK
jgi:DNA modification methylase